MIASIDGEILEIVGDSLVVGVGGVGLRVFCPAPLRDRVLKGEKIFLHTYLVVREDALSLYGFDSLEARDYFVMLLGVNGIGPRIALAILSVLSTDVIRRSVIYEQPEVFSRVPGVGNKTAQKIVLFLQGKMGGEKEIEPAFTDVEGEVIGALTSLGYSIVEAQAALQSIPRDAPQDVESRLRLALQYFST
ncbi:MAG: Holliday junction branch migration protein RuvA [Chloroflexi bacterium]|nr:Holliday junction branch migration protein RuvA [Chloroflexota bacterium]